MERVVSFFGLFAMIALAWLMSSNRRKVPWRVIAGGLLLQITFAGLLLGTKRGRYVFEQIGELFKTLIGFVDVGSGILFALNTKAGESTLPEYLPEPAMLLRAFGFGILPTIIFFSALMAVLYHLRIMQVVVWALAWLMQRTLGTSGAETLSAAANIFVGQTEAPLVIRPYVGKMTQSELMVVMVGGFATIAGGVMAVYVGMGIDAGHLLTASVISAPAALLIAKVMQPETETPETSGRSATHMERTSVNVIEAAAEGATAGLYLALNVGAMLIAFFALIAMLDAMVGYCATWVGYEGVRLEDIFGFAFAPLAWLMGVEYQDCRLGGQLLGIKWFGTEFMAYLTLGDWLNNTAGETRISDRSATILTYALCGFANFASIGIQIGGISAIAPERRADLARLGLRAMFGGTLAACMTGCVAGVLYSESWNTTKSIGGADAAPAVEQPAEESPEAVPPSSDNDSEGDSATVAPRGIPKVVAANRTDANRAGGQLAVGDPVAVRAVAPAMTWQSAADILSSPSVSRIELLATLS